MTPRRRAMTLALIPALAVVGCAAPADTSAAPSGATVVAATPSPTPTPEPVEPTYEVPDLVGLTFAEASMAILDALPDDAITEWDASAFPEVTGSEATGAIVESQTPRAGTEVDVSLTLHVTMTAPPFEEDSYEAISPRDWALVAKDPDSHVGERVILYGHVTQFDSATGPDSFRADTDAERHDDWYDYETNTIVVGESQDQLAEVVQDDVVQMWVTVDGALSYDTQIGGSTTVPQVSVQRIKVLGQIE